MIGKQAQRFQLDRLETPIGTALLVTDDEGFLRALDWSDYRSGCIICCGGITATTRWTRCQRRKRLHRR